jgi:hypothetical protein
MNGSPNKLRITWQFYEEQLLRMDPVKAGRLFARDKRYFDHFNLRPSVVRCTAHAFVVVACGCVRSAPARVGV